jgi:cytochrome c oxidase cbb3-type subunit 3
MTNADDKLLDHDYDGIRELDNELPAWWLLILYGSIAFAVVYMIWFHVLGFGYLSADEYNKEIDPLYVRVRPPDEKLLGVFAAYHSPYYDPRGDMTPWKEAMAEPVAAVVVLDRASDTSVYTVLSDEESFEEGRELFYKNCASCHGRSGEGSVGPNLTDDYWIHGARFSDIVKTVEYGVPAKGMISWRGYLKKDQILQTASFVHTLKGTNPPNAKAPEGDLVSQ